MACPEEFIFTLSYEKNSCIAVTSGSVLIGEVSIQRGQFTFGDNSFCLHSSQMYDFLLLLKKIGLNLANKHDEEETTDNEVRIKIKSVNCP